MKPGQEGTAAPSKEKPTKAKRSVKPTTDSQKDLLARLQHLRSTAQETSQAYLTNLEHDIVELVDLVRGAGNQGGKRAKLKAATMKQMMDILEKISIKPEKGRRKDLRKIEQAVETMRKLAIK